MRNLPFSFIFIDDEFFQCIIIFDVDATTVMCLVVQSQPNLKRAIYVVSFVLTGLLLTDF